MSSASSKDAEGGGGASAGTSARAIVGPIAMGTITARDRSKGRHCTMLRTIRCHSVLGLSYERAMLRAPLCFGCRNCDKRIIRSMMLGITVAQFFSVCGIAVDPEIGEITCHLHRPLSRRQEMQ